MDIYGLRLRTVEFAVGVLCLLQILLPVVEGGEAYFPKCIDDVDANCKCISVR